MSSDNAIERLRELLDERGVKWRAWDGVHPITVWAKPPEHCPECGARVVDDE